MSVECLLKKIITDPENADLYFSLACEYEKSERLEKALAALYKAESLGFDKGKVLLDIGRILRCLGNYEESVNVLEKAQK